MEKKDNTLFLFKNENKKTEKHPDIQGSGTFKGTPFQASGWRNTAKETGKPYWKIVLQDPYNANTSTGATTTNATPPPVFNTDDDLPF